MARGGSRKGSGRKPGSVNRMSMEAREAAARLGKTPLEYMLSVMGDTAAKPERRDDMAKAAAPYVHPKLAAIEHSGKDGGPLKVEIVRFGDTSA